MFLFLKVHVAKNYTEMILSVAQYNRKHLTLKNLYDNNNNDNNNNNNNSNNIIVII